MLATKAWVMWNPNKGDESDMGVCDRETWNDYAKVYLHSNKPTEFRFVMESDSKDELYRMKKLTQEN